MAKSKGFGVHGGTDLLEREDRIVDSETAEQVEDLNDRLEDTLSQAIQTVLRRNPGGFVDSIQFTVVRGPELRDTEITYSRFYWQINLLVDMLSAPMNDEDQKANSSYIKEHTEFAKVRQHLYMPIIGQISLAEIERILL